MAHSTSGAGAPDISLRTVAFIAGFGLLGMAVLAPLALFGVLNTLVEGSYRGPARGEPRNHAGAQARASRTFSPSGINTMRRWSPT